MLAAALGYIEASVVVCLRQIIAPVRQEHFPQAVREPLPLLTPRQLSAAGQTFEFLLFVELAREVAPIVVLLAMAAGLRGRRSDGAGFFMLGFGVWDIFYYVFLKVLLDWPASLATWDVLYLIPTAWVAPVWAPLAVSAMLVAAGLGILLRREAPRSPRAWYVAWLLVAAGAALVLASFFLRTAEAFAAVPRRFDWPWFLGGYLIAGVGIVWLLWPGRRPVGR